jgi:hypothetical protein
MPTTEFTITAGVTWRFHLSGMPDDEHETAYPIIEITYGYSPGSKAFTPRGEYGPIDPPDPPEIEFISAKLIDGDGLDPDQSQVNDKARDWLDDDGFDEACANAEEHSGPGPDAAYDRMRDEPDPPYHGDDF